MRVDIKKLLTMFFLGLTLISSVFLCLPVLAQGVDMLGTEYAASSTLGNADPRFAIGSIIQAILGLLGIGGLIMFIYSGFEMMTSGGNDQKVNDAKRRIWYTFIGMSIIFCAYAITRFVLSNAYQVATGRFFN